MKRANEKKQAYSRTKSPSNCLRRRLNGALTAGLLGLSPLLASSITAEAATSTAEIHSTQRYQASSPILGLHFTTGRTGVGAQKLGSPSSGNPMRMPIGIQMDIEPITSLGTLSFGPSLEYQHFVDSKDRSQQGTQLMLAWSYGGQIRYSAHYSERQWLVPTVAYHYQFWNYKLTNAGPGEFHAQGPGLGLWFYLNALDRSTSGIMRRETPFQRAYITLDWKKIEGGDERFTLQGDSFHAGLRLEI